MMESFRGLLHSPTPPGSGYLMAHRPPNGTTPAPMPFVSWPLTPLGRDESRPRGWASQAGVSGSR